MSIFQKIISLFSVREKRYLCLLLAVMIISALLEVVGVASIMPFMALLVNPHVVDNSAVFKHLSAFLHTSDSMELQQAAGILTLIFLTLSNGTAWLNNWMVLRFTHGFNHDMSYRLLCSYMQRPYEFFLSRNTAELSKNILTEVQRVSVAVLVPALQLTARSLVVVCLIALMIVVKPLLTVEAAVVIGTFYAVIYVAVRRKLNVHGRAATQMAEVRFKAAVNALGGIKEIKIAGREKNFQKIFYDASLIQSRNTAMVESIALSPKYLLEVMAFGGLVILSLVLLRTSSNPGDVLPVIALYAFAGYRLMPAMQQIYSNITMIRYHGSALDILHKDLAPKQKTDVVQEAHITPLPFAKSIEFSGISYTYPGGTEVLHGLSLSIPRNAVVGFAGTSGAGKTTLIDIFLGLLQPTKGSIEIDGRSLTSQNMRGWQSMLGYVPQHIFLTDDSIAANIAFGVLPEDIDKERLECAARSAHLHDFISTLPKGYDTFVGDRGVRLSGGQRQRIGIARALYSDPPVLVLDEATSALDGSTEGAVMEAITELSGKKTILIIAHRLTTLRSCNQIHLLGEGRIITSGSYEELMKNNAAFRTLAQAQLETLSS